MLKNVILAVDIGGSHISSGIIDENENILDIVEFPFNQNCTPNDAVGLIVKAYKQMKKQNKEKQVLQLVAAGVCCPGQAKDGILFAASNLPLFHDVPLSKLLSEELYGIPVALVNDADAAIYAEVKGKSSSNYYRNKQNIAMITIGTGIGLGLFLNGNLYQGSHGVIEGGHMIINNTTTADLCPCGQNGCVEVYSSAKNTTIRYNRLSKSSTGSIDANMLSLMNAKEVFEKAQSGDTIAIEVINNSIESLATLCINICRVVDPDIIVLAGGMALAGETLRSGIETKIQDLTWKVLPTQVKIVLGFNNTANVGILGSAMAAMDLYKKIPILQPTAGANDTNIPVVPLTSSIEKKYLEKMNRFSLLFAANEKIPSIEVENIYELGKLVALRFLEWVADNPTGVIALPTGRTPEYFIKTLERIKTSWNEIQYELQQDGLQLTTFPAMNQLTFVMLDEFFPMLPSHKNSFCHYITHFYTDMLNISKENILTFDLITNHVLTTEELTQCTSWDQIDLSLLTTPTHTLNQIDQQKKEILVKVQEYCLAYENKIRALGGIGFVLGGIGPDGHIAFNQPGSTIDSLTRLVNFNYPTAAAAAGDLGGIEMAKRTAAMTIGLGTITYNPNACIIIMAAGEGKADVVRAAIEDDMNPLIPGTCLQNIPGARFYITHGAASKLTARIQYSISNILKTDCFNWAIRYMSQDTKLFTNHDRQQPCHMIYPPDDYKLLEKYLYDSSGYLRIPVDKLCLNDLNRTPFLSEKLRPLWLNDEVLLQVLTGCARKRLIDKIEAGLMSSSSTGKTFMHTAPHHDDIMLSYHGAMHYLMGQRSLEDLQKNLVHFQQVTMNEVSNQTKYQLGEKYNGNTNYFVYLTSGFHSVNDSFLQDQIEFISQSNYQFLSDILVNGQLTSSYDDLMNEFHVAFLKKDSQTMEKVERILFLRKMCEVFDINTIDTTSNLQTNLINQMTWVNENYLKHHVPGDGIPKVIQLLKGCMRETEVDRVWALSRMPMSRTSHMRSKFYNDDFFTPLPSLEDDAMPVANLLKELQPEVISVAFDPEGTGPDTHYKVLQVVAAGLKLSLQRGDLVQHDPMVWGYRNVWFVFHPTDANLFIPIDKDDLNLMHDTFMACFTTQKTASYPSPFYDGPFSAWARDIQMNQKGMLACILGNEYFDTHPDVRVRKSEGFVFIKAMNTSSFLEEVDLLKSKFEMVSTDVMDLK